MSILPLNVYERNSIYQNNTNFYTKMAIQIEKAIIRITYVLVQWNLIQILVKDNTFLPVIEN